jgi:hypothetical protein
MELLFELEVDELLVVAGPAAVVEGFLGAIVMGVSSRGKQILSLRSFSDFEYVNVDLRIGCTPELLTCLACRLQWYVSAKGHDSYNSDWRGMTN